MSAASIVPVEASPGPEAGQTGQIGFKDWAVICHALGQGLQSLILRKGGIAEGRDGFRFKHERFFLFPTRYHQQYEKVRPGTLPDPVADVPGGNVEIRSLFVLEFAHWVNDWEKLARLEPFHVWREDVVRERFDYESGPGLQCAFGRVYRLAVPWTFPDRASYGGCRSWVTLPEPPLDLRLTPVLSDREHERQRREINAILPTI